MKRSYFFISVLILFSWQIPLGAAHGQELQRATRTYEWSFPRDHGKHESFQTEWWYLTGVLTSQGEELFSNPELGFQLTFFRRRESASSARSNYLAHAALSNFKSQKYLHHERISSHQSSAGAAEDELRANMYDWRVEQIGDELLIEYSLFDDEDKGPVHVRLLAKGSELLRMQGDNGFSLKGHCEQCASHYYSLPYLELRGKIKSRGKTQLVQGLAWYDHEFMTNSLQDGQEGWDWFSLYGQGGERIMCFRVRGEQEYRTAIAWESKDLPPRIYKQEEIHFSQQRSWKSEQSGAEYPVAWQIKLDTREITIAAILEEQEFRSRIETQSGQNLSYWEGAIRSRDRYWLGYLEMTGYGKFGIPGL